MVLLRFEKLFRCSVLFTLTSLSNTLRCLPPCGMVVMVVGVVVTLASLLRGKFVEIIVDFAAADLGIVIHAAGLGDT